MNRRQLLTASAAALIVPTTLGANEREIWAADTAATALADGQIVLIDIRSRDEWKETGVAQGAWPVSMHERGFETRLGAVLNLSEGRPIALICATGGRSAQLLRALRAAGYDSFVDVSEGMLGSRRGPGWIARGLPVINLDDALTALPPQLT